MCLHNSGTMTQYKKMFRAQKRWNLFLALQCLIQKYFQSFMLSIHRCINLTSFSQQQNFQNMFCHQKTKTSKDVKRSAREQKIQILVEKVFDFLLRVYDQENWFQLVEIRSTWRLQHYFLKPAYSALLFFFHRPLNSLILQDT